jgi:hypothetical protein
MSIGNWICLFGLVSLLAAPAVAGIPDVKVTTDRSIDCSSLASIARDLYRDCKTDEEKAIATWYFVRRMHFHWPHIPTWDSLELINSYGFALCGYQSTMYVQICGAGGLKARTMHPTNHVIAEAFYDGGWHMFDCQVGWYALNRKGSVASCAEMKADPTLVTQAVEEGRASKPYFQCRDDPRGGTNYAATARTGGSPGVPKKRLIINLRRGETITRVWGNEGKSWHQAGETKWTQPHHGCTGQSIDANDPVNWPYWKPYAIVNRKEGDRVVYGIKRYYGNGRMAYEPDLATDAFTDGLAPDGMKGAKAGYQDKTAPKLHPAAAGKPASITFVIDSPYVAVDAWLDAEALRKTDADLLTVHAKGPKGDWQKVWAAEKTGRQKLSEVSLKNAAWASHRYFVKFEMTAGTNVSDVGLDSFKITTVFMNNMYALPYFMPGKNTIRVAAAEGADLKKNRLTLEYAWEEQGKEKTFTRQIDKLPFEASVQVAGADLPRMKYVKLSVAP